MIPDDPIMPAVRQRIGAVIEMLRAGDTEAGARQCVETIAFGPGAWTTLSPEYITVVRGFLDAAAVAPA